MSPVRRKRNEGSEDEVMAESTFEISAVRELLDEMCDVLELPANTTGIVLELDYAGVGRLTVKTVVTDNQQQRLYNCIKSGKWVNSAKLELNLEG